MAILSKETLPDDPDPVQSLIRTGFSVASKWVLPSSSMSPAAAVATKSRLMGTPLTFRILHTECSPNWGGQEMRIFEQIQWLNNNKHLAWLAAGSKSRIIRHARRMGLPCVEVEFRGSANPKAIFRLYRFVKKNAVDLIDAHSSRDSCLVAWLRLFGYRVVRSLHVTKEIKFDFFHAPFWRYGSDRIIVTAELIKNRLTKIGLGR